MSILSDISQFKSRKVVAQIDKFMVDRPSKDGDVLPLIEVIEVEDIDVLCVEEVESDFAARYYKLFK